MKLTAYPEYKDSGVPWLGEIPSHWDTWKVTHVFDLIGSGTTPKSDNFKFYDDGDILWVTTSELREKRISDTKKKVTQETMNQYSALKLFPKHSVAIAMYGATIGRLGILDTPATFNQACCVFGVSNKVHQKFWFYWLWYRRPILISLSNGGGQPNLNQDDFCKLKVPLPPLNEQQTIVNFLDAKLAHIDTLISKQQQLLEKLAEQRTAVISHAVTKGLDPNAPMKDSGVEWLGKVPEGWEVAGIKRVCSSIVDYRGKTPNKVESGIFLVTAKNIKDGIINYTLSQEYVEESEYDSIMRRGLPKISDVLMTTEAPLGEVAQIDNEDIALAQRVLKFRGNESTDNTFLKYFMISSAFQDSLYKFATGSTALGIKAERLSYLKSIIPSINEQQAIVTYLDQETAKIDKMVSTTQDIISKLQEYRSALITQAVTGKIDVRHTANN